MGDLINPLEIGKIRVRKEYNGINNNPIIGCPYAGWHGG